MIRLPVIHGLIRRRFLVNYRVDPETIAAILPPPFRPKLQKGFAIAGVCLIRLEQIRPAGIPRFLGHASENAAHRIAVIWDDNSGQRREGVFIPRRDTDSRINALAGGRIFPGEHSLADFKVADDDSGISLAIRSLDGKVSVELRGTESDEWPEESCFQSLAESSAFFENGCVGYSATREGDRLDGLRLDVDRWQVRPLSVTHVESSFFSEASVFPTGAVIFDHALVMRDIVHRWHEEPSLRIGRALEPAPLSP